MDSRLTNAILTYTRIIKDHSLTDEDKYLKIKELSYILHNELINEFIKEMSEPILEEYNYFIKVADKFLEKQDPNDIKVFTENNKKMISFKNQKKPLLSAYEISSIFLDEPSKEHLFLFTIFLSNDEDILKMNLIS